MLLSTQRVLHQTSDLSVALNDHRAGSALFPYVAGEYLFIGAEVPFNNLWIDVSSPNAATGTASVDIWFANAWYPAVDVIDETAASGIPLAIDGRINFTTDRLKGWDPEQDSADVTGLTTTAIYNMYWARLKWTNSLTGTTALAYVGQKFSRDTDLFSFYPDLNNADLMTAFAAGKTDWNDQHYMAAQAIVRDLIRRQIIISRGQILDYGIYVDASCHRAAEIIYRGLGKAFEENRKAAEADYSRCINMGNFRVDKNGNAILGPSEKKVTTHFLRR